MITVHGRTRCQFYKGRADWAAIARWSRRSISRSIANGDIVDGPSARAALDASGAAGVMVGRGAIGRPWLVAEIAAGLAGRPADLRPRGLAYGELVARHARAHLDFYGVRDRRARHAQAPGRLSRPGAGAPPICVLG